MAPAEAALALKHCRTESCLRTQVHTINAHLAKVSTSLHAASPQNPVYRPTGP